MSIVYFDSSAFVKLIVDEDGSELAAALWDGAGAARGQDRAKRATCRRIGDRWPASQTARFSCRSLLLPVTTSADYCFPVAKPETSEALSARS